MNLVSEEDHVAPPPLANAEVRLRQARNYLRIMEPLLNAELERHDQKFSHLLNEVLGGEGEHPDFGGLGLVAASVAYDRLEEMREQLPRVLFNSLLIYADSMVDAMLLDCIEAMESLVRRAAPKIREKSPYQRRMYQLQRLGLPLTLPADLDAAIKTARRQRNSVVHEDHSARSGDVSLALGAAEGLLSYLQAGLIAVEESPDFGISRFERQARRNEAVDDAG